MENISNSAYPSQRQFARKIKGRTGKPIDQSALSLMLRGKRAMQLHEARQFAELFGVPLLEVLARSGVVEPKSRSTCPACGHKIKK